MGMNVKAVPSIRIRNMNRRPVNSGGDYVLYWMTTSRRANSNYGLQRAAEHASRLKKPLVVFEGLRCGHQWAAARYHHFVADGMRDNQARFHEHGVTHYPWMEPSPGAGKGLLQALARRACVVVGDDFPVFFLPRMTAAAAKLLDVAFEIVDSIGLLPLHASDQAFSSAYAFRRFLHESLHLHIPQAPEPDPLSAADFPRKSAGLDGVRKTWPALKMNTRTFLKDFPINHGIGPGVFRGGTTAARERLEVFLNTGLSRYGEERSHPSSGAASGLSPWLHWGHISAHEVFQRVMEKENWDPSSLPTRGNGRREGFWKVSLSAQAFLDELITWRELGFHYCAHNPMYDRWESLPAWARDSLTRHAADKRPWIYALEQLDAAATHDGIWNAAQRQLLREGFIHNYMRMLWGKKILEWSSTPMEALENMIELNNRYSLDGRNANSYNGIFWVMGRFDRPWGPERPIYGMVRYMSSAQTAKKFRLAEYLAQYAA
ncbi:MAG: hypothetical protein GMKNLPBB_02832 [Myxococcota bacterium]|nr:hypothetical protein [Myxococcota bacterium]